MSPANFEKVLRAFVTRKRFRPFTIELANGSCIEIGHPEAIDHNQGMVIYRSTRGIQAVFECTSVVRFIDATGSL